MNQNSEIFTSKIKIARVVARLNVGGPARHCYWLFGLDLLESKKYYTNLFCGKVDSDEDELPAPSNYAEKQTIHIKGLKRKIGISDIIIFYQLVVQIFKFRPHIIHTHTSKAGFHGRLAGLLYNVFVQLRNLIIHHLFRRMSIRPLRVIHTFHGHTFHGYFYKWKGLLFLFIERILGYLLTDRIVVISEEQRKEICDKFRVAQKKKFKIIPLGIDVNRFNHEKLEIHRGEFRKEVIPFIPADWKLVATISRIAPIKNHKMIIDVCVEYIKQFDEKICFIIIGGGAAVALDELKRYANKMDVSKHFVFTGNRLDLERIYAEIDCTALTSFNEGTPVCLLESMASKVPCIATKVGGIPDLLGLSNVINNVNNVNNVNIVPIVPTTFEDSEFSKLALDVYSRGILIENFSVKDYAKKLNCILYNDIIRNRLIENAYHYVKQNHSVESLIKNVDSLYQGIL